MTPLFVYGTLLRGEPNHRLLSNSIFCGEATTEPVFTMLDLGGFPAIISGTTAIHGEVYEVGRATLMQIDRLEGAPYFYEREFVSLVAPPVARHDWGKLRRPYIYVLQRSVSGNPRVIASGSWRERLADRAQRSAS